MKSFVTTMVVAILAFALTLSRVFAADEKEAATESTAKAAQTVIGKVGVYSVKLALRDVGGVAYKEAWTLSNSERMFVRGGSHPIG